MRPLSTRNISYTNRDDSILDAYLLSISKYPLLSPEQEVELTIQIQNGDLLAKEKLINSNLRFVVSVAKQYQNFDKKIPLLDIINEGNIGLN